MKALPGVIILGIEYQALGLLRQLETVGVRCVLVDQDAWGPALFSRYRCSFHRSPGYSSPEFWPWLVDLARKHGYLGWVLIPTDDEQVRQLSEHFEDVNRNFLYPGLPWETYRHIYDKRHAYAWASQNSIPTPLTYIPSRRDDFPEGEFSLPAIVKPAIKRTFSKYCKKKAIRFDSTAELAELLDGTLANVPIEELLYQEMIPGDGRFQWSFAGFFLNGQPVGAFTACRRRQHPPDFGRASTYVIAEYDEEVECLSREVMAAFKYTGLAEVEWKRDPRDGRLKFLEINARSWGWHSLASRVVGNLPKHLYDYLVHGFSTPLEPKYGFHWVKWITDLPVVVDLLWHRDMTLSDYLKSITGKTVHCEWDQRDPFPMFLQFLLVPYLMKKRSY